MKRILAILLCLLIASPVWSAVAIGNITTGNYENVTPQTISHNSNGNYLVLCIPHGASQTISSVTFNAVSMTQKSTLVQVDTAVDIWELVAPAAGAHNLVITASGNEQFVYGIFSFSGVNQVTPSGTVVTRGTADTGTSVDVTGSTDGMVLDCTGVGPDDTVTVGAGQTERLNDVSPNAAVRGVASTETGAGLRTMSWTWVNANYLAQIGMLINAATVSTRRNVSPIVFE